MSEKLSDKQKIAKYAEAEKLHGTPSEPEPFEPEGADSVSISKSVKPAPAATKPQPERSGEKEKGENAPEADLAAELEAAKEDARQKQERLLRISAEFENYKKRALREIDDFRKFANEAIIKELLPVIDNLERALEASEDTGESSLALRQGVEMTLKEVLRVFEKFGIQVLEAKGEPFDPTFHQAFTREEAGDLPENTVTRVFQKGYLLHGRLLRPAMVAVAVAPQTDTTPADQSPSMPESPAPQHQSQNDTENLT